MSISTCISGLTALSFLCYTKLLGCWLGDTDMNYQAICMDKLTNIWLNENSRELGRRQSFTY